MRRIALPFLAVLLLVGCSRAVEVESEAPSGLDPVGTFDFTASIGGETRTGHFTIERAAAGYEGLVRLEGEDEPAQVRELQVSGQQLTFDAVVPSAGETFTFDVAFTGDTFSGNVIGGMGAIPVTGRRRD